MALRGKALSTCSASSKVGTSFSMPTSAKWMLGSVVASRPLPSFSVMTIVPVSAMAILPPEMPKSASKNLSRICSRATLTSFWMSLSRGFLVSSEKRSEISSLLRWMAGKTMWEGVWCASWQIHSPKSVSLDSMPNWSRWWLR